MPSDPHAARHKEFDKPEAAQIIAAIQNPEAVAELRFIFEKFDKDHSGGLDLQEWRAFGKYLYEADVEKPLEQYEKEVQNFSQYFFFLWPDFSFSFTAI